MLFLDWEKAITHEHSNAQSIMTDASIIALTNKLKAARKETKNFLKMIEKSDVSSKVEATKEETHGDCWDGRKCQENEFGHCVTCCECKECIAALEEEE